MGKKRNDFDIVGAERMTDAELSKKLGSYQRTEDISISLGVILVIAGCISMFIRRDPFWSARWCSPVWRCSCWWQSPPKRRKKP